MLILAIVEGSEPERGGGFRVGPLSLQRVLITMADHPELNGLPETDRRILKKIFAFNLRAHYISFLLSLRKRSDCLFTGKDFGSTNNSKEQLQALVNAQMDELLSTDFVFFRDRKKAGNDDPIKQLHYCYYGEEEAATATQLLICTRCRVVMSQGGNVSRHLDKCVPSKKRKAENITSSQSRIDGFMTTVSVSGTLDEQQQLTSAIAKWVATNSRPFAITEDLGLKEVIRTAMKIGAKRRNIDHFDVGSIIPTRNTVSSRVNTLQEELLAKTGAAVVNHLETVGGAFSTDYGKRKDDYLTIVLHVVYEWKFYSIHAAMLRCEVAKKDNAQVWIDIVKAASSFGLTDVVMSKIFCASDEGSNITKALRNNNGKNVFCICHVANNLCKRTFNPYKDRRDLLFKNDLTDNEKLLVQRGRRILTELKIVVNGVRGTEVGHSLQKKLPLEVETRWLSKLKPAKAFKECEDELFKQRDRGKLSDEVKRALRYLYDERADFDDVLLILLQFEYFVQFFQKDTAVIYEVWTKWHELKERFHTLIMTSETDLQSALARSAYKCMMRKENDGVITKYHQMATLLHPKRRQLRKLANDAERREIIFELKELVKNVDGAPLSSSQAKAPKLPRTEYDDLDASGDNVLSEVDSYLVASFPPHDDPLLAWKERAADFPILSRIVCQLYAIPASTATAERSFSDLRNLVPEKRENIGAESVFNSLVVRSLLKFENALNVTH